MAARNDDVAAIKQDWVELTAGDVTNITFQNKGSDQIIVLGTIGSVKPAASDKGIAYASGKGEVNTAIADLFLGIASPNRLWVWGTSSASDVFVSHA